jgi:Zn-dependent M28 family amino/carboxypeptidase
MDHVGSRCRGVSAADAICNGADDDASGTAGVVELAEALALPGARPKRSVIFLTVSAEERGLWGSRAFAQNPPVDIESIVANFNMDMIGRNWPDTIVAIGKSHSDLGRTVDDVAAAHPELGLKVVDDLWPAENLYGRSDHFSFARRGVPVLFFTSGLHADYHAVTDSPEKIDAEKEARILRLVFHLTQEIGNRAERPKWKKESYDAVVGR